MNLKSSILLTILLLSLATTFLSAKGKNVPRVGYYSRSCPRAESIVKKTVQSHFKSDATVAPALLRMHFHDCFVQGCDGSVLLDGPSTEKTASPNQGLSGWEVIDDAKKKLEAACPGVVSCADILALAARDSVVLTKGIDWKVPTGRLDGRVSLASETSALPGFRDSIKVQKEKFKNLGLNTRDLVTLVGGHTIGTTSCQLISYRLYNFNTTGNGDVTDPAISPSFLSKLKSLCPQNGDETKSVDLDTGSANLFDTKFFKNLKNGRGVLESDQMLWTDASTRSLVQRFLGVQGMQALNFNAEFGRSMVKMSKIGLKPAAKGEIRRVCSVIN